MNYKVPEKAFMNDPGKDIPTPEGTSPFKVLRKG